MTPEEIKAVKGMTTKEAWMMFGMFAVLLTLGIVGNSIQNGHFNAIKKFTDEGYVKKFTEKVKEVSEKWFVEKGVYGDDMTKNTERFQQIENRLHLLSSAPRQPQAGAGPQASRGATGGTASSSASVPAVTASPVPASTPTPAPNAAPIPDVPQPTASQPSVATTNSAVPQSPSVAASQAPQQSNPATGGAVASETPRQSSAVTAGNYDCNELREQLDQANQKLDQIHGRLSDLPDKRWQTEENKRVMDDLNNLFKSFTPPSRSSFDAPPPAVEPRPTAIPKKQQPKTQTREDQSLTLRNPNSAQSLALHEEFVEAWEYRGRCLHKFVLKDKQGQTHGAPYSRFVSQQLAYRR